MHNGVPYGLAGAVLIVIVVLALGVVDVHHGEGQRTGLGSGTKPMDTGGGLLTTAQYAIPIFFAVRTQIAAIVDK